MREFAGIEADKLEHFIDAGGGAGGVPIFQSGKESDIFRDGEMREEAGVLNDVTDAAAEADVVPSGGRTILDEGFPFRGKQHSVCQLEECGLAAATAVGQKEWSNVSGLYGNAGHETARLNIVY